MRDFIAFKQILRQNRHFRRLWFSHLVSLLGDWLSYIAVAVISIEQGEGAIAIAMVMVAHSLPTVLIAPFAGRLADRFDRKKIIMLGYLVAAALTVVMFGAAKAGMLYAMQLVLLLRVAASSIAMTARSAAIPSLVERSDLQTAHALLGLSWSIMFTFGLALGGVAAEFLSPSGAILLDAFTFILAAFLISKLPALFPSKQELVSSKKVTGQGVLSYLWQRPKLLSYVVSKTPDMVINSGAWVTLNLVAGTRLAPLSTALALGVFQCVRAIGTGVGPLIPEKLIPRIPLVGTVMMMVGVTAFASDWGVPLTILGLFCWGAGGGHNWIMSSTASQSNTDDAFMGRVAATESLLFSLASCGGALLSGYVSQSQNWSEAGCWVTLSIGGILWLGCWLLRLKTHQVSG